MAGIEKVCEFSGDYPGWLMRTYKRNHIQICPEYRKEFRKARHILVIKERCLINYDKGGWYHTFDEYEKEDCKYFKSFSSSVFDWKGKGWYKWEGKRGYPYQYLKKQYIKQQYDYCLYCPDLTGQVDGFYHEMGRDISTTKRKLKRMLKLKRLNIIALKDNEDIYNEDLIKSLFNNLYS